jgi:hypothetical protein
VPVGDLQQWARLWLGDLSLQRGDVAGAMATWDSQGVEEKTLPGRIMRNLRKPDAPMPVDPKKPHAGDIAYFNARAAQIRGRSDEYRANLEQVVKLAPVGEWPVLLANRLLEQSAYAQPPVVPLLEDEPLATPTTDQVP